MSDQDARLLVEFLASTPVQKMTDDDVIYDVIITRLSPAYPATRPAAEKPRDTRGVRRR